MDKKIGRVGVLMYCTQCGQKLNLEDRYCSACGTIVGIATTNRVSGVVLDKKTSLHEFGTAKLRWWGKLPPISKNFPHPYGWLQNEIMLTVYDKFLAVTPAEKRQSKTETAGIFTHFMENNIVTGSMLIMKDKVSTAIGALDNDSLNQSFTEGELLWCRKEDAEIWEFQQKRFLGLKTPSMEAVNFVLNGTSNQIPFLFPLNRSQRTFLDPVNAIGCSKIVKKTGIPDEKLHSVFIDELKNFFI